MARNLEFNEETAIQKVMEVFWQKGYNGASMRDLTAAMNINASSLYRSICDKHALFIKCIKNYTEGRMQEARKFVASEESALSALIDFINVSADVITRGKDSCLALKTTFEVAAGDRLRRDQPSQELSSFVGLRARPERVGVLNGRHWFCRAGSTADFAHGLVGYNASFFTKKYYAIFNRLLTNCQP